MQFPFARGRRNRLRQSFAHMAPVAAFPEDAPAYLASAEVRLAISQAEWQRVDHLRLIHGHERRRDGVKSNIPTAWRRGHGDGVRSWRRGQV